MVALFTLETLNLAWQQVLPSQIHCSVCRIPCPAPGAVSAAQLQAWQVSPRRQPSFTAGRVAAQAAMCRLGVASAPMLAPQTENRRIPAWPPTLCGSITHLTHFACAAVAKRRHYAALGIDVAPRGVFRARGRQRLGCESEWALLAGLPDDVAGRLLFSLKESAYKALAVDDRSIGFLQAELTALDVAQRTWSLRLVADVGQGLPHQTLTGAWLADAYYVYTAGWVAAK